MKLNHDCVRDILLFIEENLKYHEEINQSTLAKSSYFAKYNNSEVLYALELMVDEGFITCRKVVSNAMGKVSYITITGLTWSGHELLDNIRNDTAWNAVKEKTKKIGRVSIKAMASAAGTLATAMLTDPNAVQNFVNGAQNLVGSIH